MCITQIFLGRIFFSLRSYLDTPDLPPYPDSPTSTTKRSRFGVKPRPSVTGDLLLAQPRKSSDLGAATFSMRSNSSADNSFRWGGGTRKASTISAFGEADEMGSTFLPKSTNALDDHNFLEMMGFDRTPPATTPEAQSLDRQPSISFSGSRRPSLKDSKHRQTLANLAMISPSTTSIEAGAPSPTGSLSKEEDGNWTPQTLGKYRWGEEANATGTPPLSKRASEGKQDRATMEGFPEDE
jgi:hypothetical protein